jgi:signal transduction histidine kinase
VVAYAIDESPDSFVDEFGQPVALPPSSPSRAVTPMVVAGRAIGFIAHDPAVLDDPRLVGALSAAAALAMSNSTLQVVVRARVVEVEASRERLVQAAHDQRRRLERRLQAGAVKRLERVSALLAQVQPAGPGEDLEVARLRADLEHARTELADLARGVHPATLTSGGLRAALAELVRRSPLPVDLAVDVEPADPLTEATLYFLCSEALTNAAKHAAPTRIAIDLRQTSGSLRLVVSDDGRGGARFEARGGLRGLADRVEALGGRFRLESAPAAGTTIRVELPRRAAPTGAPS